MGIRNRVTMLAALAAASTFVYAIPAAAQATRTWVSGVGDDVNPCSRTAPCKTFAGAISKTAAGGEINCLDPGGYGAVTIIKSMTIDCHYTEGGALAGGNGITVNDAATATPGTAVVVIRGLDIFGVNPPTHGIRFVSGASLLVDKTIIRRFNSAGSWGISFQPSGPARLFVTDTIVAHNGNSGGSGGGILVQPTGAAGSAKVELTHVKSIDNAGIAGLRMETTGNTSPTGTMVSVRWSQFSGNTLGVSASVPSGSSSITAVVTDSMMNHNSSFGVAAAGTGTSTIRVANSQIFGNGTGMLSNGGGTVRSYGNNQTDGNTNASSFTAGGAVEN